MLNFAEIRNISQKFAQKCKFKNISLSKLEVTTKESNALDKHHNTLAEQYQNEKDKEKSKKEETKNSKPKFTINTLPDYANKTTTSTLSPEGASIEYGRKNVTTALGESEQAPEVKTLEYLTTKDYKRVSPEFLQLLERNQGTLTKRFSEGRRDVTSKAMLVAKDTSAISSNLSAGTALVTKSDTVESMSAQSTNSYSKITTKTLFSKSFENCGPNKSNKNNSPDKPEELKTDQQSSDVGDTDVVKNPLLVTPLSLTGEGAFNIESPLMKTYDDIIPSPTKITKSTEPTVNGDFELETFFLKAKEGIPPKMVPHEVALNIEIPAIKIYDDIKQVPTRESKPKDGVSEIKSSLLKINEKITPLLHHEASLDIEPPLTNVYGDIKLNTSKTAKTSDLDTSEIKTSLLKIDKKTTRLLPQESPLHIEPTLQNVYDDIKPKALNTTRPRGADATEIKTPSINTNEKFPFNPDEASLNIEPPLIKIYDVEKQVSSQKVQQTSAEYIKAGEADLLNTNACYTTDELKLMKGPLSGDDTNEFPWLNANVNTIADQLKKAKPHDGCLLSKEILQLKKSNKSPSRVGGLKSGRLLQQELACVDSFASESSWMKIKENLTILKEKKLMLPIGTGARKSTPFSLILQKWKKTKSADYQNIDKTESPKRIADKFRKPQFPVSDVNTFGVQMKKPTLNVTPVKTKKPRSTVEDDITTEMPMKKINDNVKLQPLKQPQSSDRRVVKTTAPSTTFVKKKQDQDSIKPKFSQNNTTDAAVDLTQKAKPTFGEKTTNGAPSKKTSENFTTTASTKSSIDDRTKPGMNAKNLSEVIKADQTIIRKSTEESQKTKPVDGGQAKTEPSPKDDGTEGTTKKKLTEVGGKTKLEPSLNQNDFPTFDKSKEPKPTTPASAASKGSKKPKTDAKGKNKLVSKQVTPNQKLADDASGQPSAVSSILAEPEAGKQKKASIISNEGAILKKVKNFESNLSVMVDNFGLLHDAEEHKEVKQTKKKKPVQSEALVVEEAQEVLLEVTPTTVKAKAKVEKTDGRVKEIVTTTTNKGKENIAQAIPIKATEQLEQLNKTVGAANDTMPPEAQPEKKHRPTFGTDSVKMLKKPKAPDTMPTTSILKKKTPAEKQHRKSQDSTYSNRVPLADKYLRTTVGKSKNHTSDDRVTAPKIQAVAMDKKDPTKDELHKELQIFAQQLNQPKKSATTTVPDVNAKAAIGKPVEVSTSRVLRRSFGRHSTESRGKSSPTKLLESGPVFGQRPELVHEKIDFRLEHKPIAMPRRSEDGYFEPVHIKISDFLASKFKKEE